MKEISVNNQQTCGLVSLTWFIICSRLAHGPSRKTMFRLQTLGAVSSWPHYRAACDKPTDTRFPAKESEAWQAVTTLNKMWVKYRGNLLNVTLACLASQTWEYWKRLFSYISRTLSQPHKLTSHFDEQASIMVRFFRSTTGPPLNPVT